MKSANAVSIILSLSILSAYGAANKEWMQISPEISFQSRVDPAKSNAQLIRATNSAIDRMLKHQGYTTFSTSPYTVGMEDMNGDWDASVQMAWHLLGFYVDCTYNSDNEHDDHHRRVLHEDEHQHEDQHREDEHHEDEHRDDHHDEEEVDKTCTRKTMYAVVSFLFK